MDICTPRAAFAAENVWDKTLKQVKIRLRYKQAYCNLRFLQFILFSRQIEKLGFNGREKEFGITEDELVEDDKIKIQSKGILRVESEEEESELLMGFLGQTERLTN